MAGNTNTLSKKTIVAIVIAIVLLFVASLSVGIFLANRGDAEAAGGNQISDVNQTENNNQNTSSDNNQAPDQNTNIENNNTNSNNTENNNTENNNPETPNTDGNAGTVVDNNETTNNNTNNNGTVNNAGNNTENRTNNNTAGVTTDANVNQVGETTVTRVEEREKLVSRAYWDWWKPMTVALTKSNVGVNQPELSVKKTVITEVAGNKFVYAGQEMTYVIAVTNNSDEDVKDIEITDKIPEKTTFVSIEDATVDGESVGTKTTVVNENTVLGVKWKVTVPAGKTVIARFTVQVNKEMLVETDNGEIAEVPTTGTISNVAIANGEESKDPTNKPDEGGETKVAIITAKKSSEIIRFERQIQENEKEAAELGDLIEYTITVENTGDIEGTTYIQDNVPAGTEFVSAEGDAIISEEKDMVAWSITLGANETITRRFVVRVIDTKNTIKNTATVGGNSTNTDEIETIDYTITKTAELKKDPLNDSEGYAKEAEIGDVIEYTITVTNNGSKTLEDINVIDDMLDLNDKITLEPNENKTYTISHEVTKDDIKNAKDSGKIYNYAVAIYDQRDEYDKTSTDARTDYYYTIYHVEKDNPSNVLGTNTGSAELAAEVTVAEREFTGYECDGKSSETIKIDTENNVAYVYYTRIPYGYTIYHVEKGNIDNVLDKDIGTAEYESEVEVNSKTILGYKYDHKSADTIKIDTENNVAYVYYTRNSYGYTIYHVEKDNPENVLDTVTETAEYEDVITVTEKEFTGYKYDSKSAKTIKIDTENNVAYVYYTRNSYGYTIYHVEEGNEDNVLGTDTGTAEYEDVITVTEKTFTGYEYDSKSVDKIKIDTENNVAYVYYTRNSYGYTIYHVEKDNPENVLDTVTETAEYEDVITVTEKEFTGYKYDSKSAKTIKIDTENNVAYVYYEKLYTYTVEYYFNGVKNDNYTISSETLANVSISFDRPETLDGYTYISYVGFDGILNGSMTTTTGTNIIRVDYGKAVTTIQKEATQSVNAGEEIEYTITVKNTGYLPATVTVRDELKGTTYVEDSANIEPIITETTTQTLTWKNVQVSAATDAVREQTTTITFKVKTANASFGTVIENRADIIDGGSSNTVTTTVNEITVKSSEYKEGQKGSDLNIIFVLDNSSSMNETIEGVSYLNNGSNYVAPGDEPKTRIYNAKKAVKEFINEQNSNTTMSVITFNTNTEAGITNNMATLVKEKDIKSKTETRKGLFGIEYEVTIRYTVLNGKEYEVSNSKIRATDGNDYYYILPDINYGPTLVGTNTGKNAVSNSELETKVDNISISSEREGFGTYVKTAFNLINNDTTGTYISKDKKNIVIVLADGDFSGDYKESLTTLKQKVDGVYCIGFGSGKDYNETKLVNMSTNKKCYKASNAKTLLEKFKEIKEEASGTEKTGKTVQGTITLTATNEIKVSTECPIIVTYNTGSVDASGNPVMAELFKCTSTADLARYGLTITNKNTLTWDAKVYVQNTGSTVPSTVYLKYYIPRSNG